MTKGGEGQKISKKLSDVIYGSPLTAISMAF